MIYRVALLGLLSLSACTAESGGTPDAAVPYVPRTVSASTGDWMVPPATEMTRCMYTQMQGDQDLLIGAYRASMLVDSHHFNMFFAEPTNPYIVDKPRDELTTCDGGYKAYLAGSQWTEVDEVIPNGLYIRVPAGSILVLESHYVNTGDGPVPARVDVELDSIDPAIATEELGLYFNYMEPITLEPQQHVRLAGLCPTDTNVDLVFLTSHMHHFGESFEINLIDDATGDSTPLYLSEDYAHPIALGLWNDPVHLDAGKSLEWACNYRNTTDTPVVGGGSAEADEMCIMAAFYYPKKSAQPYCFDSPTATPLP